MHQDIDADSDFLDSLLNEMDNHWLDDLPHFNEMFPSSDNCYMLHAHHQKITPTHNGISHPELGSITLQCNLLLLL